MQNTLGQPATRLVSNIGNMATVHGGRAEVLHADTLSAMESVLLLGSFLTLAASLVSLAAL